MSLMEDTRWLVPAPACPASVSVTLVGAGPGDPGLLTLRALEALQGAQVVLYDQLVSAAVLALIRPGAERIPVGKQAGHHALSQQAIIERMLQLVREGRPVVRLKGGDGYIFGRGGEEAAALAAAGVPFEVIPGITAAQGAAASVGIPLTHRDHARTLVLATGHLRCERPDHGLPDEDAVDLDWPMLARPRQTVVIYMGLGALPVIARQLMAHGLPGDTPAALIEQATRAGERCLTGTLAGLPALACREGVRAPALIVIGTVVGLRAVLECSAAMGASQGAAAG